MEKINKNKCPECDNDTLCFMGSLIIKAPMQYFHNLSKTSLRKADIEVWGFNWDRAQIFCSDCGFALLPNHFNLKDRDTDK
jgi:hypothetical protein